MSNVISETGHIVNILPPIDLNGSAKTSDYFNLGKANIATIIVQLGVTGAASTITVKKATDNAGTGATAIAFRYRACTVSVNTVLCDVLGAWTTATAAGFATSTNDNIFYEILVEGAEVSSGGPWVAVSFSDPAVSTMGSAVAVLTEVRYGSQTAITAVD